MTTPTRTLLICIFRALIPITLAAHIMAPCVSRGQTETPADPFASAIAKFKTGKFEDARTTWLELETKYPNDPTLLLNLGLIAYKEKQLGAALGLWRKGLAYHPTDESLANAVDFVKPKLVKAELAREFDTWEELRRLLLLRVSPVVTVGMSAAFFFLAGWLLLRWWGARRRALEEELAKPPLPLAGIIVTILFLFLLSTSIAIFIDHLDIRGTIIVPKAQVFSAPDMTATALFDVFEGMEVILRDSRNVGDETWRRVTYPGGNTGWIRDRDVLTSIDSSAHAFAKSFAKKAEDGK